MKFEYKAYDKAGAETRGVIEAADEADAIERARRRGLYVTEARPARESVNEGSPKAPKRARGGANRKHLALMARELSVLVSTGTPLVDAIAAVERQANDEKWRAIVHDVRMRLEEGSNLADALQSRSDVFDPVFRSLIAAGESSGRLDEMLMRLATLTRRQMAARGAIIGALMYPALLLTVCTAVLIVMITLVLPRFAGLFDTIGAPLPATTKVLIAFSEFLRAYWLFVVPGIVAAIVGGFAYTRTPSGAAALDTAMIRAPQFGKIVRSLCVARIVRLMGELLDSRVPMIESIELTRASVGNHHYAALLARAEEGVTRGESVSEIFGRSDLIPSSTCEAIRNGEQSGRLSEVLVSLADYMDEENQSTLRSLGTLLEPVIMIFLGLVVGFVAVSMFLPLFDLTASAGGAPG